MKFLRDIIHQKSAEAEQAMATHTDAADALNVTSPVEEEFSALDTTTGDAASSPEDVEWHSLFGELSPAAMVDDSDGEQSSGDEQMHETASPDSAESDSAASDADPEDCEEEVETSATEEVENVFADDTPQQPTVQSEESAPIAAAQPEPASSSTTFEPLPKVTHVVESPIDLPAAADRAAKPEMDHLAPEPVPAQPAADVSPAQPQPEPRAAEPEAQATAAIEVPPPAAGRSMARAGRARTRILGFNPGAAASRNPFEKAAKTQPTDSDYTQFPVGWLVVVDGPGRGAAFTLFNGVAQIGRGESQTVRLDFGDNSISRENHAAIAFDPEENRFFIGHGGKANLVRCNGMPVLSTQPLTAADRIRIGETTLLFTPLCGPDFGWNQPAGNETSHAARG
ncbi:FHA domain-containing protein [Alisedimentitalea sp. MJ-SS2]|uniref:FHA domain-containing protein n=1 Tax=Aliisedimentitalea sp. MJ-SS2 TaxID=3049795 RepID=UPI0029082DB3|nr:FHA domain-containing protein [Alisedimentitalea sp. MJ-SS2]MDU8927840.1 FHA domain-containing protein [Alisedimentitalea sp. MJ-SS2]